MTAAPARLHRSSFYRGFLVQACWNVERMQNLGFLFCMEPWLKRIYRKPEDRREAELRHLEYFNTHPYMAGFVAGMAGRMEERIEAAPEGERAALRERLRQVKRAMGSSLAAIGDAAFWGTLKPVCAAAALWTALVLRTWGFPRPVLGGVLAYLAAYNAPALWVRWHGSRLGYAWAEQLPAKLKEYRWREKVRQLRRVGLAAAVTAGLGIAVGAPDWPANAALIGVFLVLRRIGFGTRPMYAAAATVGAVLHMAVPR